MEPTVELGISLASLLPWSAFFPEEMTYLAKMFGYDFVCVLPFRMVKESTRYSLKVKAVERAWNPGSRNDLKAGRIELHDWVFFPGKKSCEKMYNYLVNKYPQAQSTVHTFQEWTGKELLEVSPRLWSTEEEISKRLGGRKAVIDTMHQERDVWPSDKEFAPPGMDTQKSKLSQWEIGIPKLLNNIALVHLQSRDMTEINNFLSGIPSRLEEKIRFLKSLGYRGPFLAEFSLAKKGINPFLLVKVARKFYQRVQQIFR